MGAALLRAFSWIDVVVRGEAELVLPGLVRDLLAQGPIRPQPGFCYREHGTEVIVPEAGAAMVPMDELPTPNYDEYFERLAKTSVAAELSPDVQIPYEASRGCWWGAKSACTFCGLNGSSMQPRRKSPTRVVEELAALASRYGRLDFCLADTILHQDHLRDALPGLRDLGLDLRIFCEIKANLTRAQVRSLRDAGVDHIQPGIESLSDAILKLMGKGTTPLQNVRLLKWCAEYGVAVTWNLLYGLPGEPPEEYARMADVLPSLSHLTPPRLVPLYLDRFSPYFERPAQFGLTITGVPDHYAVVYPVEETALGDLAHWFTHAYADGRDPEQYIGPVRRVIDEWNAGAALGFRSLQYGAARTSCASATAGPTCRPATTRWASGRRASTWRARTAPRRPRSARARRGGDGRPGRGRDPRVSRWARRLAAGLPRARSVPGARAAVAAARVLNRFVGLRR